MNSAFTILKMWSLLFSNSVKYFYQSRDDNLIHKKECTTNHKGKIMQ